MSRVAPPGLGTVRIQLSEKDSRWRTRMLAVRAVRRTKPKPLIFSPASGRMCARRTGHRFNRNNWDSPLGCRFLRKPSVAEPAVFLRARSPTFNLVLTSTLVGAKTGAAGNNNNPVAPKQSVTFTAKVTSQFGGATTGTVTFKDGSVTVMVALTGGVAAISKTYSTAGTHFVTATYSGDGNNVGSTSGTLTEYVVKLPVASQTVVNTSGSPSLTNQPVTLTATATSAYGPIQDGENVTFYDGTITIGTGVTMSGNDPVIFSAPPADRVHHWCFGTSRSGRTGSSAISQACGRVLDCASHRDVYR